MSNATYFVQECPTCGRRLQIRVEYLGRKVVCQHCQGQFAAFDQTTMRCDPEESADALLRRADALLKSAARQRSQLHHCPR